MGEGFFGYTPPPFFPDDVIFEVWCERGDESRTFEEFKESLISAGLIARSSAGAEE